MDNRTPNQYISTNIKWSEAIKTDQQSEDFYNSRLSSSPDENKKLVLDDTDLGQVFTPPSLAKFMVELFREKLKDTDEVLDPCIGPNTFLSCLSGIGDSIKITGIELDESLISDEIRDFYNKPNRQLIIDSFFNLPLSNKYDFIIQNPPFVRQEEMMTGENSKTKVIEALYPLSKIIPSKSNLYVYFLLKSILHLKVGGVLVAIFYDSWLYSEFGGFLKEALLRFGTLEEIYHIKESAFPDAYIGATVILFKRVTTKTPDEMTINIYSYSSFEEMDNNNPSLYSKIQSLNYSQFIAYRPSLENHLNFQNTLFLPISAICNMPIQRGIASKANQYFIHKEKKFEECVPFIKDVTSIKTYHVNKDFSYLLAVETDLSHTTKTYLDDAKNEILKNGEKFKALSQMIMHKENWFKIKLKKPGNTLFNYYLRNNIDFIFNEDMYYSSDNFYIMNVENYIIENFAILNSTFTKISILHHSRNQGNGLRKIQLYEFSKVRIIDVEKLSHNAKKLLNIEGGNLLSTKRYSSEKHTVIRRIDEILLNEYNSFNETNLKLDDLTEDILKYNSNS